MPEWTEGSLKEYKQFMDGNRKIHDTMERNLRDLSDSLQRAWTGNQCLKCPLAELTALAAATLKFYLETRRP